MIYSLCVFGLLLGALQTGDAYTHTTHIHPFRASTRLQAEADWTLNGAANVEEELEQNQLTVRFINTPSGKDVIVKDVVEGSNLLLVGDNAGVKLPRACRTGLCGSCTCEVKVPGSMPSNAAEREGFVIIRACSVKCSLPPGMDEMVIDVHRMRKMTKKGGAGAGVQEDKEADFVSANWVYIDI
jgi:ferredoxin